MASVSRQFVDQVRAAVRGAGPHWEVNEDRFLRYVTERLPDMPQRESLPSSLRLTDLYLAFASLEAVPAALAELERRIDRVCGAMAPADSPGALSDELAQRLRMMLLVSAPGRRPKLAEYSGRGTLNNWLRAVALRAGLRLKRAQSREIPHGDDALLSSPLNLDPELRLLRTQHAHQVSLALKEAMATLSGKERSVLRLYAIDGVSLERIGRSFKVSRATAWRWIDSSRRRVFAQTCSLLADRLRLSPSELNSLLRAVQSEVEFSLSSPTPH